MDFSRDLFDFLSRRHPPKQAGSLGSLASSSLMNNPTVIAQKLGLDPESYEMLANSMCRKQVSWTFGPAAMDDNRIAITINQDFIINGRIFSEQLQLVGWQEEGVAGWLKLKEEPISGLRLNYGVSIINDGDAFIITVAGSETHGTIRMTIGSEDFIALIDDIINNLTPQDY